MDYDDCVPQKVAVNEAVELAKKFGGSESPSFVNGVLARFIRNAQTSDSPKEETPDTTV